MLRRDRVEDKAGARRKPAQAKRKSLPQELRALRKRLPPLWADYDATPEHRVDRRFQILRQILVVHYAQIQLAENLEAVGEKVGAEWGWGKDSPKDFYALLAYALQGIQQKLMDCAKRAIKDGLKRPENLLLASEIIDAAREALERWRQLSRKFRG